MASSQLRKCPTCQQAWPDGEETALRGFGWLDPLPRGITVSNIDGIIHDGAGEQDRFLVLEEKWPEEPLHKGQLRLLRALASIPNFAVRVLRGTPEAMTKYNVTAAGLQLGTPLTAVEARAGIVRWIDPAYPIVTSTRTSPSTSRFDPFADLDVDWPA